MKKHNAKLTPLIGGNDYLEGGQGNDTYVWNTGDGLGSTFGNAVLFVREKREAANDAFVHETERRVA
jgi:Ca2+-binding RTX toxin-like protein